VAGNYADWEPNRSVFNGSNKEKFRELMHNGKEAQDQLALNKAVSYYLQSLSLSDDFAETHYRLGKSYELLGYYDRAWKEFKKAVDYDAMPLRCTEEQNNFIKTREDGLVFTTDAVEYLRRNDPRGIIGFNFMIDGHHPNLRGYILISHLIAEKIRQIFNEKKESHLITEEEARRIFHIDDRALFKIYVSRGRWLMRLATWRFDPLPRLRKAEGYFSDAMAIDASRFESYLGLAMCYFLQKDSKKAEDYLLKARTIDPSQVKTYLKEYWIGEIIKRAYNKH
jgi:tetratricopeptide (TPR) repeat protein